MFQRYFCSVTGKVCNYQNCREHEWNLWQYRARWATSKMRWNEEIVANLRER